MTTLIFAEQRDGKFKKSSLETVRAARGISDRLGASCVALVAGSAVEAIAGPLGAYGAQRVIAVDQPDLAQHTGTAVAKVIAEVARQEGATLLFLAASAMGKDVAPRVAARLEAGLASDCVAVSVE